MRVRLNDGEAMKPKMGPEGNLSSAVQDLVPRYYIDSAVWATSCLTRVLINLHQQLPDLAIARYRRTRSMLREVVLLV